MHNTNFGWYPQLVLLLYIAMIMYLQLAMIVLLYLEARPKYYQNTQSEANPSCFFMVKMIFYVTWSLSIVVE